MISQLAQKKMLDTQDVKPNSEKIRGNYIQFNDLLVLAEKFLTANDPAAAAGIAQIAARLAFTSHCGLFASPRLERLLHALSRRIPSTSEFHSDCVFDVLHVLTYARPVGGDTRFVWRWIQQDSNHCHSVVVTRKDSEVPKILIETVENSGGRLWSLHTSSSTLLEQALELRNISQKMSVVILHLFPDDIIPMLAFANNEGLLPIILVNHSDHTFWIGISLANVIVHLRKQSPQFLLERRGLVSHKSAILPIPFTLSPKILSGGQAKRALGYEPDMVLLLTIASAFKYESHESVCFLNLVSPVLEQNPKVVLLAVGPKPEGFWHEASLRTNGRIVALGTRWDNDLLYAAADVYLDSFPFSSITSLIEAGSHGTPLLAYYPSNSNQWLLGPGAPGLEGTIELADSVESYQMLLTQLIQKPKLRCQRGRAAQKKILSLHTGTGWSSALSNVYHMLKQSTGQRSLISDSVIFNDGALDLAVAELLDRISIGHKPIIDTYLAVLPYRSRVRVLCSLLRKKYDFSLSMLLPPQLERIVSGRASWAGRILRQVVKLER